MRRLRVVFSAALLALAVAGCQFIDLKQELKEMEKFTAIEGTVVQEGLSDAPVAVALFSDALKRKNLINAQLIDGRTFRFFAPPGKYFLFAFEDRNQDFNYQRDQEPAGFFGDPSPIVLEKGTNRTGIQITLRKNLALPQTDEPAPAADTPVAKKFPKLWVGRRNIGAVAALTDSRFDKKFAAMGLWKPLQYSLELGPGLFLLEPHDPHKTPVLFVHGIGGSPRAWQKMIDSLDRARFQPWIFQYASGLPLKANVEYLFDALTQLRLVHRVDAMHLVAHSMGGLVSQGFLNRHKTGTTDYLKSFTSLSTPWGGHSAAKLGVKFSPAVVPVWRDMAPDSQYLAGIRRSKLPPGLPHYLFFSHKGAEPAARGADDGVVTVASQREPAALRRASKIYGFRTSHVGILSDETVLRIVNATFENGS